MANLSISATSINWGEDVTITYDNNALSNGTTVAYTISGVTSSQINNASLSGNFVMSGGTAQVTLTTTRTDVSSPTLTLSITGYSVSCLITFLTSLTGSNGAFWSSNLAYTAETISLSNNASIPYTITGANVTSQQLSNISLTGTFTNIVLSLLSSTYFDGTGDYLNIPNVGTTAFQFGTGDFTIEFWIKTTDTAFDIINQYTSGGTNWSFLVVSGNLYWQNSNASTNAHYVALNSLPADPTSGSWTHVAITRTSGTLKYWINGTGDSSTTADSTNYQGNAAEIRIGSGYYGDLQGNISNLRVVKGVAVYTGNFTVPTSPLTVTQSSSSNISAITSGQTSLLTCNRQTSIIDTSTHKFLIAKNGNVAANTEYPSGWSGTANGNPSNVGSGTLLISTNSVSSLTTQANGFINVGGTTKSFVIRNGNITVGNTSLNGTQTINFVNTETSDIHSENIEGITNYVSNISTQNIIYTYGTTQTPNPLPIYTLTADVHFENIEGKTFTIENVLTTNNNPKIGTTIQTIIPMTTFAYSSGTEISANGNVITVAPVNQLWYI